MNTKNLKVGRYYLISSCELESRERGHYVGKFIEESDNSPYLYLNKKQVFLFQFEVRIIAGHDGRPYSKTSGKDGYCWFVTKDSIIKELTYDEAMACML